MAAVPLAIGAGRHITPNEYVSVFVGIAAVSDRYRGGCVQLFYSKCDVAFCNEVHGHCVCDADILFGDWWDRDAQCLGEPRMPMDRNRHKYVDPAQRFVDRSGGREQVIHCRRKP